MRGQVNLRRVDFLLWRHNGRVFRGDFVRIPWSVLVAGRRFFVAVSKVFCLVTTNLFRAFVSIIIKCECVLLWENYTSIYIIICIQEIYIYQQSVYYKTAKTQLMQKMSVTLYCIEENLPTFLTKSMFLYNTLQLNLSNVSISYRL